jgi:biotin carboxyl carrier protein
VGDAVEEGDVLLLLEAMKMEHQVVSPVSGVVESMSYQVNDVVGDGAILAIVESVDDEEPEAV